jgi:hypothetical protein
MAVAHYELSNDFLAIGRVAEASSQARAGVAVTRKLMQEKPGLATRKDYAALVEPEAEALARQGNHEAALARFLEMQAINQDALAAQPKSTRFQIDRVTTKMEIAAQLIPLGKAAEARPYLADAVQAGEALLAQGTRDVEARQALADARVAYADALASTERTEALAEYEKAARELRELRANDRFNMTHQGHLGALLLHQAEAQRSAGLARQAAASLEEGAALAADLRRRAPAVREHQVLFARARLRQGQWLPPAQGRACGPLREAAEVWASLESRGPLDSEQAAESLLAKTAASGCPPVAGR